MFDEDVGPPPSDPVEPPDEAVEAQLAQGDFGGIGSVTAVSAGGLTINLLFDAAAMAAPASFRAGIQQAAAILTSMISDHITVNMKIDYSGTGGGAAAGPDAGQWMTYSSVRSNLINNASPGDTTFNALPATSSIQGQSYVAVWNSQLKLWGGLAANDTTTDDGSATFATDINPSLLVGVALHELTHAFGRVPYGPQPDVFDLFRFSSPGVRLMTGGATAGTAYFSIDGGITKLGDYGQSSDPSDFLNSGVQGANDPFNEFYTGSTLQTLTTVDLKQMDALGFHLVSAAPVTIEALGSTSLVQLGLSYFLNPVGGGTGPQIKFGGSTVQPGQFGGWTPIGAEINGGGYQIAWKVTGSDFYTVWNTDSSGNYTANAIGAVSGGSAAFEAFETSFHQDLNGDGSIGAATTVIEALGSTSLVQSGSNYFMNPVGGGTGPQIKFGGSVITVGQFGGMNPIAAEAVGGGYQVAWKMAGQDLYTVWNTDSSGNYTANAIGAVDHASSALAALETNFQQDLNGDGSIGVPATVIEALGSTSLVQSSANYFMNPVGGGTGPQIKFGGSVVTVGQFGGMNPIGAEAVGGGYQVAWKMAGQDLYTAWNTDSSGNYTTNAIGAVNGASSALINLETDFHQDLNGDGIIGAVGVVSTVIESFGSTSLVQSGSNYFMNPVGGGTGPQIKFGGSVVTVGQFGGMNPIGAEAVGGGYQVAWKMAGQDLYTAWNTDSSGNYTTNAIGAVNGASSALINLETDFHQDLNGDGIIGAVGVVSTVIESFGSTSLVQSGSNYFMNPVGGGTGPQIKFGGSVVTVGQFGGMNPIGAEAVGGGYQVAWKMAGQDLYTAWNTDSSGNYTTNAIGAVNGASSALINLETDFHQDLNGDGIIGAVGVVSTVIESFGSTSLVQSGSNYFMNPVGGGTGPQIKFGGSVVTVGQFGGMNPIGAEAVGGGYQVAWKMAGQDLYTAWNTDSSGNYTTNAIGAVNGASSALINLETDFHQDLNGDGIIGAVGVVSTVIESFGSTSLVQSGSNYFMNPVGGGTGPQIKFGGSVVTVGQFGGMNPIGAEAVGGGYQVAWKMAGQDLYTAWNTDSSGNYTTNAIGAVNGASSALINLETDFHQDLNGDGIIGAVGVVSTVIESFGSTSLVQSGSNYFMNPVGGGTGPQIKFGGSVVTVGQFGGMNPIGAEAVGGGYQVAWKMAGQDLYTAWNTDSSGNYTTNAIGAVNGASSALINLETDFHQDLNGDGIIGAVGVVSTVIESFGSTSLVQSGSNYFMNPVGGGTGPQIKFGGSVVTVGQFGGMNPIGAEAVGGGYQVAWKMAGQDLYTAWNTDSSGNYTTNAIGAVNGASSALINLETDFHQDLNGDGIIGAVGVVSTVIESFGSTSLVQSGSNYFMNPVGGGTGPQIKFGGSVVTVGQFGGMNPIGAEAVGGGYQVAWKMAGQDLYTAWNTDSSGNYTTNAIGAVNGASSALINLETDFHQDLNGDGIIGAVGVVSTVIESFGSTSLVQSGSNYFMNPVGGGTGPQIKFGGSVVTVGQFGGMNPIGAEAVGGGYQVAWKMAGQDLYTAWNTDSSGNYTTNAIGAVNGASSALINLETDFHQDLNGDGIIGAVGVVSTVIESFGSTSLVQSGSNYFMNPVGGGTGPQIKFGGSVVTVGQFGGMNPIGAEAVGGGYQVAWKMAGQDLYTAWNTDSSGNYTTNAIGAVNGASSALINLETDFHQDLNGDGIIGAVGVVSTVIESFGSTSLVQSGSNYFMNPVGGGTGPQIKFGGSVVTVGQFGGMNPIGAEAVGGGYLVAWKMAGQDLYTVWNTDSSGNYTTNAIGAVNGASSALTSLEASFHQDLNGNGFFGTVAAVATVIESLGSTSLVQSSSTYSLDAVGGGTGPKVSFDGSVVTAGQFGGWTPIGAEATAGGYQIAWKMAGQDIYTVWNTDTGGNYVGNAIGAVAGSSASLEALESSFNQDLNGDGTTGLLSHVGSLTASTQSAPTSGSANTVVTISAGFGGELIGFGSTADPIDVTNMAFASLQTHFDAASGQLSMSDGTNNASFHFTGSLSQDGFHFASDGQGGTLISGSAAIQGQASASVSLQGHDTFVFAQHFGQVSIADFTVGADRIVFSQNVFADQSAVQAAIHQDAAGNAVITDAAQDTITIEHVSAAELLSHLSSFHLV
ncbi:NF038122 family metalloprotease [Bradyrhizobium sp. HKCCYLS20291]|uniref:NF038122 family metalloprotease n=1 Tax=Bradyrhizobium sp. HKCCYLS20291 TaxID=3420766 RepID=UPI003EBC8C2C